MKLTVSQLRRIIKEEVESALTEATPKPPHKNPYCTCDKCDEFRAKMEDKWEEEKEARSEREHDSDDE